MTRNWVPAFFAISACSWMPHWACHYYRLETGTSFVVGNWNFSPADSVVAMCIYAIFVLSNVAAVVHAPVRPVVGVISGILHLAFAALHITRLMRPFPFEVFGYSWSTTASAREVLIVGGFGVASIAIGLYSQRVTSPASSSPSAAADPEHPALDSSRRSRAAGS